MLIAIWVLGYLDDESVKYMSVVIRIFNQIHKVTVKGMLLYINLLQQYFLLKGFNKIT